MRERVLITGGTGFLGKHLALAMKASRDVILCGRNNANNAHAAEWTGCPVIPMDVAREQSVRDAFVEARPDIVIHAAATKFVDLAEHQPLECTDINVLGSENVARVCMERGVKTVIGVSTDKAAPPVRNTYALTKALMERIFCSLNGKTDTRFVCVRFGNLAWSTGSVLPLWRRMLDQTGVIGTTGPEMRRFFIKVEEAVELIQTALEHSDELQGTVVTRAMKAVQIQDLLDLYVQLRGGRWERIAGRPGERDDEYLVGEMELPYTRKYDFGGVTHYAIAFNRRAAEPVTDPMSSATVERLSEAEMLAILDAAPADLEMA
jgi:UDP-N-acetylglucosamine 4,6-dehydratase/5-epimerase